MLKQLIVKYILPMKIEDMEEVLDVCVHLHFMMSLFTVNALKNSDNSISLTMIIFKLAMLSYLLISCDIPKATLVSLVRCNVICNVSLVNNIVTHVFMLPHFPTKLS